MKILPINIGTKILSLVGAIFFLSLFGMVTFYAKSQEFTILERHHANMDNLTNSINFGLKTIMLAGYADIAKAYAASQKKNKSLIAFDILRRDGKQAFLDNATIDDVNRRLGEEDFIRREAVQVNQLLPEDNVQLIQAVSTGLNVSYQSKVDESSLLTYLIPILNDKECQRCHGSVHSVRGIILITTSLDSVNEAIALTRVQAIKILVFALIGSLILIYLLIRYSIVRPVKNVTNAMTFVANGNYQHKIPVIGNDELSLMATNFNLMVSELVKSHDHLNQERNKLTTIILSSQDGIIVSNEAGEIVLVNPAAERLLDKNAQQIINEGFLHIVDDPEYVQAFLENSGEGMPKSLVYKNRIMNFHAASIKTDKDRHLGSAALIRDVTEEKKLEQKLRLMSFTDKLTGLFNRRYLEEILAKEFDRCQRYNQELSLLFFDVDHFKKFNDVYGHDMGDRVLEEIGKIANQKFRKPDYACRYGGEEFCLILPNTGSQGAYQAAENFRQHVEQMLVDGLHVTISIGCVTMPQCQAANPESFLKFADSALYEGKRAGRNRVILWHEIADKIN
ncbi:MAG: diguanylate cyclase [Magnetococcus sp. DMHC-6]